MSTRLRFAALFCALLFTLGTVGCATTGQGNSNDNYPNVVQNGDNMTPAPGYVWVYPNDPNNYSVRWSPGIAHNDHPYVRAANEQDNWIPAPGYVWVNPGDNDDLRVRPDK